MKVVTATEMARRAITGKIPFRWVIAEAAYGFSKLTAELERQAEVFQIMATNRHDTVVPTGPGRPCP